MVWNELAHTLISLIEGISAPAGSELIVTEAEVEIPMEVQGATREGELIFFGNPPHTRWVSGVLPQVHMVRLRIALAGEREPEAEG
jgi:hypothetical protein